LSAVSAAFALQPQREIIAFFQRGRAGHKILKKKCASHGSKIEAFCLLPHLVKKRVRNVE
jgi:hypothetical protein